MGWLITLGILTVLAVLPLGVDVRYDEDGILVSAAVWGMSIPVFPRPRKEKKEKPEEKKAQQEAAAAEEALPKPPQPPARAPEKAPKEKKGGSLLDFMPFVKLGLNFLGDFRRKLRLDVLDLKLTMAGDDPCDLATNYGRAWAAVGNLLPQLDRWFVIKKRNIQIQCDFTASEILVLAHLRLTITLGRVLSLAAVYGFRGLKEFFVFKKKRKGGADQ